MSKKIRFLYSRRAPGVALTAIALTIMFLTGTCKALVNDERDYLMPLPEGVIVRYETGRGSYVPYVDGLAPGDPIPEPEDDPTWPVAGVTFNGWFKDNITFSDPCDFTNDYKIPQNAGKYVTLYAKWESAQTEQQILRNWISNGQGNYMMGQVVKLEPGDYTFSVKGWMQGGSSYYNHVVAFYLDPETGTRKYAVKRQIYGSDGGNDLWTTYQYQFTAKDRWYVVGLFPGFATTSGGTFYTKEMKLIKTGNNNNLLGHADFQFGVGNDEDKTYYTQAFLATALTASGKSDSFLPGVWYYYGGSSNDFALLTEQVFESVTAVSDRLAAQGDDFRDTVNPLVVITGDE